MARAHAQTFCLRPGWQRPPRPHPGAWASPPSCASGCKSAPALCAAPYFSAKPACSSRGKVLQRGGICTPSPIPVKVQRPNAGPLLPLVSAVVLNALFAGLLVHPPGQCRGTIPLTAAGPRPKQSPTEVQHPNRRHHCWGAAASLFAGAKAKVGVRGPRADLVRHVQPRQLTRHALWQRVADAQRQVAQRAAPRVRVLQALHTRPIAHGITRRPGVRSPAHAAPGRAEGDRARRSRRPARPARPPALPARARPGGSRLHGWHTSRLGAARTQRTRSARRRPTQHSQTARSTRHTRSQVHLPVTTWQPHTAADETRALCESHIPQAPQAQPARADAKAQRPRGAAGPGVPSDHSSHPSSHPAHHHRIRNVRESKRSFIGTPTTCAPSAAHNDHGTMGKNVRSAGHSRAAQQAASAVASTRRAQAQVKKRAQCSSTACTAKQWIRGCWGAESLLKHKDTARQASLRACGKASIHNLLSAALTQPMAVRAVKRLSP